MATTLLGPLLPLLVVRWAMSDASAGALFTAQFAGQLTATTLSSVITTRLGAKRTLALGFGLVGAGVGAVGFVPATLCWPAVLVYGLGLGCVLPVTNIVVAALAPVRAASALSLVNVSWGVGAMVWPLIVVMLAGAYASGPTTLLAVSAAAIGVAWALVPVDDHAQLRPPTRTEAGATVGVGATLVASYAAMILLYVGAETAIGGWVAAFARRTATGQGAWAYAPTAFWTSQTAGRLLAPLLLRRVSERQLLASSVTTAITAVLVLTEATSVGAVIASAAVAGLGVAAIFPLLWAGVTREVAPARPAAVGPLFAAGGVGGAMLPWLVGVVSIRFGLATGLLVPLAALLLLAVLIATGNARRGARHGG